MTTINYTKIVNERSKALFHGYVKSLALPITVFNLWALVSWLTLDQKTNQAQLVGFFRHITENNTALLIIILSYIVAAITWQAFRQRKFKEEPTINFNEEADLFLSHRNENSATNEIIQTLRSKKIPSHYCKK